MKNIFGVLMLTVFCCGLSQANSLLGDKDGFGMGLLEGDIRSAGSSEFDMREADDPYFTDVWPASSGVGSYTFSYTHSFPVPPIQITEAELKLFTLGIQDGDTQVFGSNTDVLLFIDNMEVLHAFDNIDQFDNYPGIGWAESASIVTIDIPSAMLNAFDDGIVTIKFEVKQLGTAVSIDGFAIDYSELIFVPEPATLLLLALGGLTLRRRK